MTHMEFRPVHLDSVEPGVMVYSAPNVPLGTVEIYRACNGNRASVPERVINSGMPKDRFAYRKRGLYRIAKEQGVFVAVQL